MTDPALPPTDGTPPVVAKRKRELIDRRFALLADKQALEAPRRKAAEALSRLAHRERALDEQIALIEKALAIPDDLFLEMLV